MAHEFKQGDLQIGHPWIRATPGGATVGGGYLTISNDGTTPDRLLQIKSNVAPDISLHTMSEDNGVMRMRAIEGGLALPPGATVALQPSGNHIMFVKLNAPFVAGQFISAVLLFERAGEVPEEFKVEPIGYTPEAAGSHAGH